jgi:hypothetical protein
VVRLPGDNRNVYARSFRILSRPVLAAKIAAKNQLILIARGDAIVIWASFYGPAARLFHLNLGRVSGNETKRFDFSDGLMAYSSERMQ